MNIKMDIQTVHMSFIMKMETLKQKGFWLQIPGEVRKKKVNGSFIMKMESLNLQGITITTKHGIQVAGTLLKNTDHGDIMTKMENQMPTRHMIMDA